MEKPPVFLEPPRNGKALQKLYVDEGANEIWKLGHYLLSWVSFSGAAMEYVKNKMKGVSLLCEIKERERKSGEGRVGCVAVVF